MGWNHSVEKPKGLHENAFNLCMHSGLTILLVCLTVIAPFIFVISSPQTIPSTTSCKPGERETIFFYYPGSGINVIVTGTTWAQDISIGDFWREIHSIPDIETIRAFEVIPLPTLILPTIDIISEQRLYVVLDKLDLPRQPAVYRVCGEVDGYQGSIYGEGIMYPRIIEEL